MTSRQNFLSHTVNGIILMAAIVLICAVVWASDRALEITDEAYYVLSGAYPDAIEAYISAQHWTLAPLWDIAGSLAGFRLIGTAILVCAAMILSGGTYRVAIQTDLVAGSAGTLITLFAASSVGALLYVATISPSPSYNLLASAGGYAALGFAFLCATSTHRSADIILALLCGVALTLVFVNKPSSGICCAVLSMIALISLRQRPGIVLCIAAGVFGGLLSLGGLVAQNWYNGQLLDNLEAGFTLFRQVQTEPILSRLLRYALTMIKSVIVSLLIFAPALWVCISLLKKPRPWMPFAVVGLLLVSIILGGHYLGGRTQYQEQIEALVALMVIVLICTATGWRHQRHHVVFVMVLICLPYAVAMGTGNSLFTQVIVTAASWTLLATLVAKSAPLPDAQRLAAQSTVGVMMVLLVVQILTSYGRDPYHLDQPIFAQNTPIDVPILGRLKVDAESVQMVTDLEQAKTICEIAPGADFFGLYNVPGLALLLEAVPPISPWVTNADQLDALFAKWTPKGRSVLALSEAAQIAKNDLPEILLPLEEKYQFCGELIVPFSDETIELWASR